MAEEDSATTPPADPEDRWWDRPLPFVAWLGGVAVVAAWLVVRFLAVGPADRDQLQQYGIVLALASHDLRGAMVGMQPQTAPPGYPFFALPFHLLLQPHTTDGDGYLVAGWATLAVLALAAVLLMQTVQGRKHTPLQLLGLAAVTGASSTLSCYTEAYHPGDVMAAACIMLAAVAALRQRWVWAGLALGYGLSCKQWVVVPIAILAVLVHGRARAWIIALPLVIAGAITLPFLIVDPSPTIKAVSASGVYPTYRSLIGQLLWLRHPKHSLTQAPVAKFLDARVLPLLVVGVICVWLYRRRASLDPALVVTALAAACLVRPVLDPAGWVYYLAPGLALLSVCSRSWTLPVFAVLSSLALDALAPPTEHSHSHWLAACALLVTVATLAVALVRLRTLVRDDTLASAPSSEPPQTRPAPTPT